MVKTDLDPFRFRAEEFLGLQMDEKAFLNRTGVIDILVEIAEEMLKRGSETDKDVSVNFAQPRQAGFILELQGDTPPMDTFITWNEKILEIPGSDLPIHTWKSIRIASQLGEDGQFGLAINGSPVVDPLNLPGLHQSVSSAIKSPEQVTGTKYSMRYQRERLGKGMFVVNLRTPQAA